MFFHIPLTVKLHEQFNNKSTLQDFSYTMDISRNIDKQNKIDLSSESLFVDRISVSRNGIPVINSGSLIIPHGSLISIFGRSGSGKSSLTLFFINA